MNPNEQYVMSQVAPMLAPGEQVLFMSIMRRMPGLLMQALLLGALGTFLLTKHYFVVLTNRRMLLIRSKQGMFSTSPKLENLGVEEWDLRNVQSVKVGGFLANRSMTFVMANGPKQTLRITPQRKTIPGTRAFFEQVPQLINSGQLGGGGPAAPQLAHGQNQSQSQSQSQSQEPQWQVAPSPAHYAQPPQPQPPAYAHPSSHPQQPVYGQPPQPQMQQPQGGYGQPQAAQQPPAYGQPPGLQQQAGYGPPPQQMQQQPLGPGMNVIVTAPDGSRFHATIMQEQNGHFLCASPGGQGWVPAQFVARA